MNSLEDMYKFLKMYNLSRLNQEEIENVKRLIISNKTHSVTQKNPNKQKPRTRCLHR